MTCYIALYLNAANISYVLAAINMIYYLAEKAPEIRVVILLDANVPICFEDIVGTRASCVRSNKRAFNCCRRFSLFDEIAVGDVMLFLDVQDVFTDQSLAKARAAFQSMETESSSSSSSSHLVLARISMNCTGRWDAGQLMVKKEGVLAAPGFSMNLEHLASGLAKFAEEESIVQNHLLSALEEVASSHDDGDSHHVAYCPEQWTLRAPQGYTMKQFRRNVSPHDAKRLIHSPHFDRCTRSSSFHMPSGLPFSP